MPSFGKKIKSSFLAAPLSASSSSKLQYQHDHYASEEDDPSRDLIFSDLIAQFTNEPLSDGTKAMTIGLTESAVFVPFVNDQLHRRYYEGSAALARAEAAQAADAGAEPDAEVEEEARPESIDPLSRAEDSNPDLLTSEPEAAEESETERHHDDVLDPVNPASSSTDLSFDDPPPPHHPADTEPTHQSYQQADIGSPLLLRGHFSIRQRKKAVSGRIEFNLVCRRRTSRTSPIETIADIPGTIEIGLPPYAGVESRERPPRHVTVEHFELVLPPTIPLSVKASSGCIVTWRLFAQFVPEESTEPASRAFTAPIRVIRLPPLASAAPLSALRARSTVKWDYDIELPDRVICIGAGVINVNFNFRSKLDRSARNPDGIVVLESARLVLKQSVLTFDESEGKIRMVNEDIELVPVAATQSDGAAKTAWPFPTILDSGTRQKYSGRLSFASPICRSEVTPTYTPRMTGTPAPSRVKHPNAREPISIHHSLALHVVLATPGFLHRLRMAAGVWVGSCGLLPPKGSRDLGVDKTFPDKASRPLDRPGESVYAGTTDLPRYDMVLRESSAFQPSISAMTEEPESISADASSPRTVTPHPPPQGESAEDDNIRSQSRSGSEMLQLTLSTSHHCHCPIAPKNSFIRRGSEGTLYGLSDSVLGKRQTLQNLSPVAAGVMYSSGRSLSSFAEPNTMSPFSIPLFGSRRFSGMSILQKPWQDAMPASFRTSDDIIGSVWCGGSVRRATIGPVSVANHPRNVRSFASVGGGESASFQANNAVDSSDPIFRSHEPAQSDQAEAAKVNTRPQARKWLSKLTSNFT